MKLWDVEHTRGGCSFRWTGPDWRARVSELDDPIGRIAWGWSFTGKGFVGVVLSHREYTTARGARDGLIRAVRRLGIKVPK